MTRIGNAHNVLIMPIAHHGKNAEAGVRGASAYGAPKNERTIFTLSFPVATGSRHRDRLITDELMAFRESLAPRSANYISGKNRVRF